MKSQNRQIIVHQKWRKTNIFFLLFIVGGIFLTVVATYSFRSIKGEANQMFVAPGPIVKTKPPGTNLTAPYLRLVSEKKTYGLSEEVLLDLYIHTNGQEVMETTVVINYDAETLKIADNFVRQTDKFKYFLTEQNNPNEITASFFIVPNTGDQGISTSEETYIGTLVFKTLPFEKQSIKVNPQFAKNDVLKSRMLTFTNNGVGESKNILEAVEGATFDISQ